jgi:hypothetical protein
MAACKPAALCTLLMPSGKLCCGVALRNQPFCRAHSSTHRLYERDQALNPILDRLGEKIAAMGTGQLLDFLHQKLVRLPKTLSRFPDIAYTLTVTLDRLDEINQMESDLKQQIEQNHMLLAQIHEFQHSSNTRGQLL